jgi:hypothetical protein
MATVKPQSGAAAKGAETATSIRTLYCDSTTATIALNGTVTGTLDLNGAVIRVGAIKTAGTEWCGSWTIVSSAWQGSVQKVGTRAYPRSSSTRTQPQDGPGRPDLTDSLDLKGAIEFRYVQHYYQIIYPGAG